MRWRYTQCGERLEKRRAEGAAVEEGARYGSWSGGWRCCGESVAAAREVGWRGLAKGRMRMRWRGTPSGLMGRERRERW